MKSPTSFKQIGNLLLGIALVVVLAACSRGESVNPLIPTPTSEDASPESNATPEQARQPCSDGTMLVGDIPAIDGVWMGQLDGPDQKAAEWHDDAQLVHLRVSCALFGPGFRVQPSYFSAQAQAILAADTLESQPVDLDPDGVDSLAIDAISFGRIYDALIEADFTEDLRLDPSTGIDIRINSEQSPFGPDSVPDGAMVAHISIEQAGQIKDLFIDEQTGEIYRYETPV